MPVPHASIVRRGMLAAIACAIAAVLAAAPMAGAAQSTQAANRQVLVFGGFATVQFDVALLSSLGITLAPGDTTKVTPTGGLRYKIYDGKTTLKFPQKGSILSVGNVSLEQPANTSDLNFTDFTVKLGPTKSVLSARTGANIGYGGPRQSLLRIAPTAESLIVTDVALQLKDVPITLTAAGATVFNAQFGPGLPAPPFTLGQVVGTLNVKTKYYYPTPGGNRS